MTRECACQGWQPDGDTYIALVVGLITTTDVFLSLTQTFMAWQAVRSRANASGKSNARGTY